MNQYYWSMNQGKKLSNDEEGDKLQMATVNKPGRGPKCYRCGQHGHIKRDCPKRKTRIAAMEVMSNAAVVADKVTNTKTAGKTQRTKTRHQSGI